jgi:6-phosphofructokinase 2
MIATLTLNPALDKSTETERMIPEKKMRCSELKVEAGGGGINISKAVKELGGETLAMLTSGGDNGKIIERILSGSGIPFKTIPVRGETRENFVAREKQGNKQYRFVMPGAEMRQEDLDACVKMIGELPKETSFLVMSGSLPPGVPVDFPSHLAELAKKQNIKLILDTSGEPLKKALEKGVFLLKPNLSELGFLVGKDWLELSEIEEAAEQLIHRGNCEVIVASMGPAGAMLATREGTKRINAPAVKKMSTVGAGDSMVAGILWMLEQGETIENAVMFGVACGTAATMNQGTQLFRKEDVTKLYKWMQEHH